jgi:tetratricopeptide (TPR) repeat protein
MTEASAGDPLSRSEREGVDASSRASTSPETRAQDSASDTPPASSGDLYVRCSHCNCRCPLPPDRQLAETTCSSCGSKLSLVADDQTQDWSTSDGEAATMPHKNIGHFELIELLGSGGFGAVWKAKDLQLDRLVAVKIPHKGRLSVTEIEKFLREARAAAQLHHPNIVSVHEVGLADEFVYIVSDLVEGLSLDRWLTDQRLSYRDSARLCAKISEALQHAHQQGIIHRDLKPGNILIDRAGEPHITDFGLAKRETSEVTMTMEGQVFGTPAYMSPEQAKGQGHAADRRTDIYSLGAILFELLTGEHLFRGSVQMLLKQVIEDEPPSPRKFDSRVPRDLETICLKCLQKEPSSRYDTAEALADEFNRFLAGLPIRARPIGRLERAVRWCRRNPLVAVSATLALVFLLFGLAAATIGYVRTSLALEESHQSQARAEESLRQARQAVDDLFTGVSENTLLNQPGMQPLRRDLLRRARDYYERFLGRSEHDASLRDELALAYFRVGLITEEVESPAKAMPSYEKARDIQSQLSGDEPIRVDRLKALGDTLNALGRALQKQQQPERALKAFSAAIVVRKRLVEQTPTNVEYQRTLANTFMNIGLVEKEGDLSKARKSMEQAQTIRDRLLTAGKGDAKLRRDYAMGCFNLAMVAMAGRNTESAEAALDKARQLFAALVQGARGDIEMSYVFAVCCRKQADLLCFKKRYDDALRLYGQARDLLEQLAEKNPSVTEYQVGAAEVFINIAQTERERGHTDKSLAAFDRAASLLTPLVNDLAEDARYRRNLIIAICSVGELHQEPNRRAEVLHVLETLRERLRQIVAQSPNAAIAREQLKTTEAAIEHLKSSIRGGRLGSSL